MYIKTRDLRPATRAARTSWWRRPAERSSSPRTWSNGRGRGRRRRSPDREWPRGRRGLRGREGGQCITPVPGGVGPMTTAMLLLNTVTAAEQLSDQRRARPRAASRRSSERGSSASPPRWCCPAPPTRRRSTSRHETRVRRRRQRDRQPGGERPHVAARRGRGRCPCRSTVQLTVRIGTAPRWPPICSVRGRSAPELLRAHRRPAVGGRRARGRNRARHQRARTRSRLARTLRDDRRLPPARRSIPHQVLRRRVGYPVGRGV